MNSRLIHTYCSYRGGFISGDDHEMCFNGAKTYQLGWRPSLDLVVGTYLTIRLTSFADYIVDAGHFCIIKVVTPELFYFIHYNHQIGSNSQTREHGNKVMVATTGTSGEYSDLQSWVVAILDSGDSFDVPNVGGSIFDMTISVVAIGTDTADVNVTFRALTTDSPIPPPTPPPAIAPTPVITCLSWRYVCDPNEQDPRCCDGTQCRSTRSRRGRYQCW